MDMNHPKFGSWVDESTKTLQKANRWLLTKDKVDEGMDIMEAINYVTKLKNEEVYNELTKS